MPNIEKLASEGVRFNHFHTTALCSPTRVALQSGRNHHTANMGNIMEWATGYPGYTGRRPEEVAFLAEILRLNGYSTAHIGKAHETAAWEVSPVGPFDRWPTGAGYDRFYGFIAGETDQWHPTLPDDPAGIAASLPLASAFAVVAEGIEFQLDRVRSIVSGQSIVAGNVFQQRGEFWQLSFDGETKFLKDSVGLHYIACLLREPNRIIPVPILHEIVTGIPAGVLKGNSEPYFTTETCRNYERRLEQRREDRKKAEKNGDSSWLARIDKEVEQIEIELGYNLGLSNNIRERSDYLNVKRKIAEYIRRGETAVSKKHSALGLHLHNSLKKRGGFRYEPEQELDWVT